jgi:hypothetical protein
VKESMTLAIGRTWKIRLTTSRLSNGIGILSKTRRIMSGDYHTHTDRKYDEIIERLEALEKKIEAKNQTLYKEYWTDSKKHDEKTLGKVRSST